MMHWWNGGHGGVWRGEGLQALVTLIQGAPQPQAPLSYYTPILNQYTLPQSDPKVNPWIRKNGDFSLTVSSGFDLDGTPYGIPLRLMPAPGGGLHHYPRLPARAR